ncbi:hypothetical protein CSA57_14070 [candidate division KSB3 bacterium]|nr:MAG: hypothetical protein CSA57_14070 [candidate division KSB3 bacterium]
MLITGLSLCIRANTSIGIVGTTGCGKTTLIDIVLALLVPQEDILTVDGEEIHDVNRQRWQSNIGYVPQHIFLSDASIAQNIAFGVPHENIDQEAVERAARIANLHDFITGELLDGYNTIVGERGIRLSGGQRQQIGIARALYRDPAFLIFDEATRALDSITETAVIDALKALSGQKTMLTIAHRLSTVKVCDVIYVMENGKIVAQGDYDALLRTNVQFQKMVSSRP